MREENNTLKTISALAGIGVLGFVAYEYFDRKKTEETINAQTAIIKSDAINSSTNVTPLIEAVKKLIAANPKAKTYSDSEYKNFASSLYENFKSKNLAGLVTVFGKLKTNVDVLIVAIYYGVKVFKYEDIVGNFEINTYNLSQSINNLTNDIFRTQLERLFKSRGITYNLF